MAGRRIHIAGSANPATDEKLIRYAHDLVHRLVDDLLKAGAALVVGVGREPRVDEQDLSSVPTIFDWTILERVAEFIATAPSVTSRGPVVATVVTARLEEQIPPHRRKTWEFIKANGAVQVEYLDAGWSSGAMRRQRQAELGDALVVLGGGEGVEQLAELYVRAAKPVIPLDLNLGAGSSDGSGGAARLYAKALAAPNEFMRVADSRQAALMIGEVRTENGSRDPATVASSIMSLVNALSSPRAFYVRLLNKAVEEYEFVERFFRRVVDPVVTELGYEPFETGRSALEYAWLNEEIFNRLHYSRLAVVDLTGLRANCFMELGYALGRQMPVIVTAKSGTKSPFDSQMIPHFFWNEDDSDDSLVEQLRRFWALNIDRPPLVKPRGSL